MYMEIIKNNVRNVALLTLISILFLVSNLGQCLHVSKNMVIHPNMPNNIIIGINFVYIFVISNTFF